MRVTGIATPASSPAAPHFTRALGLRSAIAVNMTQMCGIGPFITIPQIIAAMGGPQAILGWILGAVLATADGLVWAELGAAMPGAGGTYLYLREAFQYRTGRLMPFLFIWSVMVFIPLTMSTGVVGIVDYLRYYVPDLSLAAGHAISLAITALVVFTLYRNITAIEKLTNVLFVIMLFTVGMMIVASFTHFDARLAFTFPSGAFDVGGPFWSGLGAGLLIATYDYLGYNTTAYMAGELRDPGRVIPRSIIYAILGIMVIYLSLNVGVLGVLPWQEIAKSTSIGSAVMENTWGKQTAQVCTALIIITAFASIMTGLLGGSRVPYNAAKDKLFFPIFGRLHPRLNFPHVALLVMGMATAIGTFFSLSDLFNMLMAVMVLIQGIVQIAALTVLRLRQPNLRRPYRMWLYPLPSLIALAGWLIIYAKSGNWTILISLAWLALGIAAFLVWAFCERTWPFGKKEIREEFLEAQRGLANVPAEG
jgi:amino acid transporter